MLPPIDDSDEGGYIEEALWISDHGGVPGFVAACFRGEYPYCQRHPLVAILVSPVSGRSLNCVRPMRFVKVAVSAVALGSMVALLWGMSRPAVALLLSSLLAVSINWYAKARVVTAEPLIYPAFFLAWALIAGKAQWRHRWFWAGLMWGLAYLAKGTAMLLVFTLPVAWCLHIGLRMYRDKGWPRISAWRHGLRNAVAPFALGALIMAGPLLVRNAARFGNPLSNLAQRCMWLDSWTEHIRLYEDPTAEKPSFFRYLRTHSASDAAKRVAFGVAKQTPRLFGGLSADKGFGRIPRALTLAISVALIGVGILAAVWEIRAWPGAYTVSLTLVGFCLFSWYAYITYASRFMATFAPILGYCALSGWAPGGRLARQWARMEKWLAAGVAGGVIALLCARAAWSDLRAPRGPVPTSREFAYLHDWFEGHRGQGRGSCFLTPYLAPRYSMGWLRSPDALTCYNLPSLKSFEELAKYMAARNARYLIVERDSLRERLAALSDYFEITAENALRVRAAPPGWRVVERDPYGKLDFVILEREGETPRGK